jgi:hypothetical protein
MFFTYETVVKYIERRQAREADERRSDLASASSH